MCISKLPFEISQIISTMDKDYRLKENDNSADNKLNRLYDSLLKDLCLSHDDCYIQINPSLFVINESIFRDDNN